MNTTFKKFSAALVLALAATSASAQVYGEAAYNAINIEGDGLDADVGVLNATIGYEVNQYLAVEAMAGTGVTDDDVDIGGGVNANIDVDRTYGVFLKPKAKLGQDFEVFARLGWAKTKIKAGSDAQDESDFAYGVGLQYTITPKAYVTGGYTNLYDKDGITVDGWTIGFGYKF